MRVAWVLAFALALALLAAMAVVPALRYTVVRLSAPVKAETKAPPRKVAVKKPEPTEQQVKEIAKRVEKKKKEKLAKEIKALERAREELERMEEERLKSLGLEEPAMLEALLEAVGQKAADVLEFSKPPMPEANSLSEPTAQLKQVADELARFDSPEDPHLIAAVQSLVVRSAALGERIAGIEARHPSRLKQVQRAKTAVQELDDLLRRVVGELPATEAWAAEPPSAPAVGPDLAELYAVTPGELGAFTNLAEQAALLESLAPLEPLSEAALEAMAPAEMYEHAQQLDQSLRDTFANTRAAELASVQGQGLAEALASTMVYPVQTPDLAEALQASQPGDRPGFQTYNAALDQAQQAVQAMRLGAEGMVGQARDFAPGGNGQGQESTQAAQLRAAIQKATSAASGKSPGQVINLVSMMGAAYRGMGMGRSGDGQDNQAARLLQGGAGTTMGSASSEAGKTPASLQLNATEITAQLLPGRKLSRDSKRQGWLYIDTWYIIGPFQRLEEYTTDLNFKYRYPPETHVDLDATYPGKISNATRRPAELRWRFYQSNTLRITPPDEADGSVYYAYTEVYFEDQEEVLIAVASDDAAKVWVNDLVVWQDTGLSPWRLDEGFRRILFRKGYNRILVRVESAPGICNYSLLLCPVDLSTARRN